MSIALGSGHQDFAFTRGVNETITDFRSIYFTADLDGAQEVSPNSSLATGTGTGALSFRQTQFNFSVDTALLDFDGAQTPGNPNDNVVGMHIHQAPAAVNGPVVRDILASIPTVDPAAGTVSGTWKISTGFDATDAANLQAGNLYINIHTAAFPGGEIRGQILAADEGRDRIDLTALNIGSFATLREIATSVNFATTITVFTDGVASRLRLTGLNENDLKASHFVFSGTAPVTDIGTAGRDDLFGAGGNDTLRGLGGSDRLFGDAGDDTLQGGNGQDWVFGGSGTDRLYGGIAADVFVFRDVSDSGILTATRDRILDFEDGTDRIDLSAIDAIAALAGNQNFTFIGEGSFTERGQLRVSQLNNSTFITLNTAGPSGPEMQIRIAGLVTITEDDLIL